MTQSRAARSWPRWSRPPGPGTLVAEDLGVITPEVDALRTEFGLPGMKVLQFAFDGSPDNPYLPEHHGEQSVVYTGTHDNDTTVGWWSTLDEPTRERVRVVRCPTPRRADAVGADPAGPLLDRAAVRRTRPGPARRSAASARMNTPGTDDGQLDLAGATPGSFDEGLAAASGIWSRTPDRLTSPN